MNFSSEIIFGQLLYSFGDFYLVTLIPTYIDSTCPCDSEITKSLAGLMLLQQASKKKQT